MKHARACRAAILVILLSVASASCGGSRSAGPAVPSSAPPPPLQPAELTFEFVPAFFGGTCGDHQVGDVGVSGVWQFALTMRKPGGGSFALTTFSHVGLDSSGSVIWRDVQGPSVFRSRFDECDLAQVLGSPGIPVGATVCGRLCLWTDTARTAATQLVFSGVDWSTGNVREFRTPVLSLPRPSDSSVAGRPSASSVVDEAIESYRSLTRLHPSDPQAHRVLANALRDQQELVEAELAFARARELERPSSPW